MSDNQKIERHLSPTPGLARNKFPLNQVVGEQLESIRKLSGESTAAGEAACSTSVYSDSNNNSLLNSNHSEPLSKPTSAYQQLEQNKMTEPANRRTPVAGKQQLAADALAGPDLVGLRAELPLSYTSIFAQKPLSQSAAAVRRNSQLRKQSEIDIPPAAPIDQRRSLTGANKRLLTTSSYSSAHNQQHQDHDRAEEDQDEDDDEVDEDEDEDDEDDDDDDDDEGQLDERMPFNAGSQARAGKLRSSSRRRLTGASLKMSNPHLATDKRTPVLAFDNKCELNSQRGHIKISLADCRPPSFNTCTSAPANQHHKWRHSQQQHQAACVRCDCANCYKKFTEADGHGQPANKVPVQGSHMFPKTYSFHMLLKSIILILLTLLLLMLFLGILMVSHHLPRALERMMNTPHSFNVTIAGR